MVWKALKTMRKGFESCLEGESFRKEWLILVVSEGEEASYGNWCVWNTLGYTVKT